MDCVLSVIDEGSRLSAAVADLHGRVLGRAELPGPTNRRFVDDACFRERIEQISRQASADASGCKLLAVCACLQAEPTLLVDNLAFMLEVDPERVRLVPAERMAAVGALLRTRLEKLVVVRSDVSSRAWGLLEPQREVFKGGHGELLGDEGSAYWIGHQAARVAVKLYEKRHRSSSLLERLVKHFGLGSIEELLRADHLPPLVDRYRLASFAPEVFAAGREGDGPAQEILDRAGKELAGIAISVVSALPLIDETFELLPCGSVFGQRGITLETFMREVRNKTMRVSFLREGAGPLGGGVLLALEHLGLEPDEQAVEAMREALAS